MVGDGVEVVFWRELGFGLEVGEDELFEVGFVVGVVVYGGFY